MGPLPKSHSSAASRTQIPSHEVFPSQREQWLVKSSTWHQKRAKTPQVVNECCEERQLTDEYERMRRNRNPQLYSVSRADVSRSDKMNSVRDDSLRAMDVADLKRSSLMMTNLQEEAAMIEARKPGGSIDSRIGAEHVPHLDVYTRAMSANPVVPSYGHRPGSAGRIYNTLAQSLTTPLPKQRTRKSCLQKAPGMGVAQLRNLLNDKSSKGGGSLRSSRSAGVLGITGLTPLTQHSAATLPRTAGTISEIDPSFSFPKDESIYGNLTFGTIEEASLEGEGGELSDVPIRNEWNNSFGTTRVLKEEARAPLPGTSSGRVEAMMQPIQERLSRYRRVSEKHHYCEERQRLDAEESRLASTGGKHAKRKTKKRSGPLKKNSAPLSPRSHAQREETRETLRAMRAQDENLKRRVEKHRVLEELSRIPDPGKAPRQRHVQYGSRSWAPDPTTVFSDESRMETRLF